MAVLLARVAVFILCWIGYCAVGIALTYFMLTTEEFDTDDQKLNACVPLLMMVLWPILIVFYVINYILYRYIKKE